MKRIWYQLELRRATLLEIQAHLSDDDGRERQPAPRKFVLAGRNDDPPKLAPQTLSVWRGQEPAERIANTILLCAIRDRARQVIMEPRARELRVQFLMPHGVREQKLPLFSLAPIVHHFQSLAQTGENMENEIKPFSVDVAVDKRRYRVRFAALAAQWSDGVTMQFSPHE